MMGGWVSDHAVMDRQLNTMHVFTGLEVRSIPPARARTLRQLVGQVEGPDQGSGGIPFGKKDVRLPAVAGGSAED